MALIAGLTFVTSLLAALQPWPMKLLADHVLGTVPLPVALNRFLTSLALQPDVTLLLGSVLAYLPHLQNHQPRWFLLSLFLLVLSLFCKSMAFVAPLLFLVLERTHGKGFDVRAVVRLGVVGVVCAGFVFFFTFCCSLLFTIT